MSKKQYKIGNIYTFVYNPPHKIHKIDNNNICIKIKNVEKLQQYCCSMYQNYLNIFMTLKNDKKIKQYKRLVEKYENETDKVKRKKIKTQMEELYIQLMRIYGSFFTPTKKTHSSPFNIFIRNYNTEYITLIEQSTQSYHNAISAIYGGKFFTNHFKLVDRWYVITPIKTNEEILKKYSNVTEYIEFVKTISNTSTSCGDACYLYL